MSQAEFYRGVEAAARALATAGDDPAARTAAVHHALQPLLGGRTDGPVVACTMGCAHCCHFPVGIRFGEAQRLALALRSLPQLAATVRAEAAATADLPWPALVGRPCPLLVDGACGIYEQRPLPCRAMASGDAAACARALAGGAPPPLDGAAFWRGLGAAAALDDDRPPHRPRELRSALAALLSDASTEARGGAMAAFVGSRALPT